MTVVLAVFEPYDAVPPVALPPAAPAPTPTPLPGFAPQLVPS